MSANSNYSAAFRVLFFCIVAILLGAHVFAADSFADERSRAKRAEKKAQQAKQLKEKMHRTYGGSCGSGLEKAGGYPPEARGMYCRYPTTKGPVKHGKFFKWWPDGSVRLQGEYWQGKKHGAWISFLPNGRKKRQEVFYNGVRQSSLRYNEKGEAETVMSSQEKREQRKSASAKKVDSDF